jgi:hypothetical protein
MARLRVDLPIELAMRVKGRIAKVGKNYEVDDQGHGPRSRKVTEVAAGRPGRRGIVSVSGFAALVVSDGFVLQSMLILLGIGMLAGAIGSGIAASRFLDV